MATLIKIIKKRFSNESNEEGDPKNNDEEDDPKINGDHQRQNEPGNHFAKVDENRKRCQTLPEINSTFRIEDLTDSVVEKNERGIEETIKRVRVDGMEAYSMSTTCMGKTFWSVIIIISSLIMIFELYKSVHDYWASPLVTTFSIFPLPEMDFPQIYICLSNNINKTYLDKHGSYNSGLTVKKSMNEYLSNCRYKNVNRNENDSYAIRMALGYDVDQLFTTCTFNNFYPKPIRCSTIVRSLYDDEYGKCYLLSLVDIKQKVRGSGLLLGLNLSHSLFMTDSCLAPESIGLKVTIAKSYSLSSPDSVFIGPGSYNNLDLTAQHLIFQNVLGGPHPQPCVSEGDIKGKFMIGNYSQTLCRKDCELQSMVETCHCITLMDTYFLNDTVLKFVKFCTSNEQQNCINQNVLQSTSVQDKIKKCRQKCYQPCDMWRYPVSSSWQPLNPNKFPNGTNVDDIVYLHVSFANMEIENFEQNPSKMFDEMISDIGGQINLWLGASMVTLIQIPVVLVMLMSWAFYGNVQKSHKTKNFSLVPRKSLLDSLFRRNN